MLNTEIIYSNFKESIKMAVRTTQINTISSNGWHNENYLFGIRSTEDEFYSKVIYEMEMAARSVVECLLGDLCAEYGYCSYHPSQPANYDILIEKSEQVFKVELKSSPNNIRSKIGRAAVEASDITYVYLLKQSKDSYDLLARYSSLNPGIKVYLFADFIHDVFGEEEMNKFNKAMIHFPEEMRDAIGYNITQICNDKNLEELRNKLRTDIVSFDYDKVRRDNDSTGSYSEFINENSYRLIKSEFTNNYTLLLGESDFAMSFLTAEWLYRHFVSAPNIDNTFIATGYFKSIEQLLWDIIFIVGNGRSIGRNNHTVGNGVSGMDKTLGSLSYFLSDNRNNDLYQSAFGNATRFVRRYLKIQLDDWISNSRNGYFHKDNMPMEKVAKIREQTYFLYFLILGSLTLSADDIAALMN